MKGLPVGAQHGKGCEFRGLWERCVPPVTSKPGKCLIPEPTQCYKPDESPGFEDRKWFSHRVLDFNFQQQFKASFIVTKTNIISSHACEPFHSGNLPALSHCPPGALAESLRLPIGGIIIVWTFYSPKSADTQSLMANFNGWGCWHRDYNKNSKKKKGKEISASKYNFK